MGTRPATSNRKWVSSTVSGRRSRDSVGRDVTTRRPKVSHPVGVYNWKAPPPTPTHRPPSPCRHESAPFCAAVAGAPNVRQRNARPSGNRVVLVLLGGGGGGGGGGRNWSGSAGRGRRPRRNRIGTAGGPRRRPQGQQRRAPATLHLERGPVMQPVDSDAHVCVGGSPLHQTRPFRQNQAPRRRVQGRTEGGQGGRVFLNN